MARLNFSITNWSIALVLSLFGISLGQETINFTVTSKGDYVVISTQTKAASPELRMNAEPSYLEMNFADVKLGKAFTQNVDKGLIQKIVTSQNGTKANVKIYVMSKPTTSLSKIDGGYSFSLHTNEMAKANPVAKPTPPKPTAVRTNPTRPERPAPLPVASPPTIGAKAPVTLSLQNEPLNAAIAQMAIQAGLNCTVDPRLIQEVSFEFNNVPFDSALQSLVDALSGKVKAQYSENSVFVDLVEAPVTPPPVSVAPPSIPPTVNATSTDPAAKVREYFPFKSKSAEKAMKAAQLAFPNISYVIDPVLNILMVEGTRQDIDLLEKFLRAQSPK